MESLALYILLSISQSLGIPSVGTQPTDWKITQNWGTTNSKTVFSAESNTIHSECSSGKFLYLPQVIHGVHSIYSDNRLVYQSGDPSMNVATPFYKEPFVNCDLIRDSSVVRWEIVSYSKYFARFKKWPHIDAYKLKNNFFDLYLNMMSSASLFLIATLFLIIFYGKVKSNLIFPFFFSAFFLSIYFLMCSYSPMSMITSHKIADISLIWGVFFLLSSFNSEKLISSFIFKSYICISVVASIVIITGSSGDTVQLGTTFSVIFFITCSLNIIFKIVQALRRDGNSTLLYLQLSTIISFLIFGNNDALHIIGLTDTYMLLPFGSVSGLSFLILAINQEVVLTYKERDNLLVNLEEKVTEKTSHLNETLTKLKSTQAELIQSAKLASLGTLSAGIAHEINNAINYVNGAMAPLEKQLASGITDPTKKEKTERLFSVMKEGVNLTVEIIKSLRNYTGLNQAKKNDVKVAETFASVLVILRNRLRDKIQVINDISPTLSIYGNVIALNQIFMNLITNAIDAMPDGGTLTIRAIEKNGDALIEISDSGNGIPLEIQPRIFDPFFTTKDVGQGTGLGLHIVQKEIEKHNGQINFKSEIGKGTTFYLRLPISSNTTEVEAA